MIAKPEDKRFFCCPKCGEKTWDDRYGYSPPVPECRKCDHLCNWQEPEEEAGGLSKQDTKLVYLRIVELLNKFEEKVDENKLGLKEFKERDLDKKHRYFNSGLEQSKNLICAILAKVRQKAA